MLPTVQYLIQRNNKSNFNMDIDKETISRLKFLGCVKKGEKINVKHMFVQPDNMTTKISRMIYNQDNRNNTLAFISNVLERAFQIIFLYIKSEEMSKIIKVKHIMADIKNSMVGIANLKHTYCDDTMFCCTLDTMLEDIEVKLVELQQKYNMEMKKNKKK